MALEDPGRLPAAFRPDPRQESRNPFGPSSTPVGAVLTFFLACLCLSLPAASNAEAASRVGLIELEGPIGPANAAHVKRSFGELREFGIDLVVLRLDTPGGLVTAMRSIVKDVLASPVPVVGFVGPRGAHAASAGTYILYSTHLAAMASATNLGAATPIKVRTPSGQSSPFFDDEPANTPNEDGAQDAENGDGDTPDLEDKIVSDAVAYIRSLAQLRGRNADWAERAVRNAASLPAGEALKLGVIELVADDLPSLLAKLDGREVALGDGRTVTLDLADREIVPLEPGWHVRFLALVTQPTVAYGLLMLGMVGLLIEVAVPGLFLPGVIGLISLLVSLYAFHLLPISLVGLGIIVLGVVLMVVELTIPGFGLIGFSGIVTFVLGSVFLLETGVPGYGVSRFMIGIVAVVTSSLLMMLVVWLSRLHTLPILGGAEELVGRVATVASWKDGEGRINLRGTTWAARAEVPLDPGQKVRVIAVDGLTLDVEPDREEAVSS